MIRVPTHLGQTAESLRSSPREGRAFVLAGDGMAQQSIGGAREGFTAGEKLPEGDAKGVNLVERTGWEGGDEHKC